MADYNKVILAGRITRDIELKYLPSGAAVAKFGFVTNKKVKNRETGEDREIACFIDIEAWERTAEVVNEYAQKGSNILIDGELEWTSWETDDGSKRSRNYIRAFRIVFLDKRDADSDQTGNTASEGAPTGQPISQPAPNQTDDDIPF